MRVPAAAPSAPSARRRLTPFWLVAIVVLALGAAAAVWILLHL
jgi:hypothetical protein